MLLGYRVRFLAVAVFLSMANGFESEPTSTDHKISEGRKGPPFCNAIDSFDHSP